MSGASTRFESWLHENSLRTRCSLLPRCMPHCPPLLAALCRRGCLTPEASGFSTCFNTDARFELQAPCQCERYPYNPIMALLAARLTTAGSKVAACSSGFLNLQGGNRTAGGSIAYQSLTLEWHVSTRQIHPTFRVPVFSIRPAHPAYRMPYRRHTGSAKLCERLI